MVITLSVWYTALRATTRLKIASRSCHSPSTQIFKIQQIGAGSAQNKLACPKLWHNSCRINRNMEPSSSEHCCAHPPPPPLLLHEYSVHPTLKLDTQIYLRQHGQHLDKRSQGEEPQATDKSHRNPDPVQNGAWTKPNSGLQSLAQGTLNGRIRIESMTDRPLWEDDFGGREGDLNLE